MRILNKMIICNFSKYIAQKEHKNSTELQITTKSCLSVIHLKRMEEIRELLIFLSSGHKKTEGTTELQRTLRLLENKQPDIARCADTK